MDAATTRVGGLSSLDWVVIVAATVSLVVLVIWMVQDRPWPLKPEGGQTRD